MASIRLQLQQILALFVSASLTGVTVPPPSAAPTGKPPARSHQNSQSLASRPAGIQPELRTANILADASGHFVPIAQSEHPKPVGRTHANTLEVNRQIAEKAKKLQSQGLAFIENKGQFDARVKFQVSSPGKTLWLTENGITFDFLRNKPLQANSPSSESKSSLANVSASRVVDTHRGKHPSVSTLDRQVISQEFVSASSDAVVETKGIQQGTHNYFSGSDSSEWRTQVRRYSEVVYHDLWKGVDLRIYGNGPDLEQEFLVEPGADVSLLQVAYKGIDRLEVGQDGSLLVHTAAGQMRESTPRIFQEISGRRVVIKGSYKLLTATSYTFDVSAYDAKYALVIDPTLLYSTYLGGSAGNNLYTSNQEVANAVAVDALGNAYITGYTLSPDFPTTAGAFEVTQASVGSYVGFVTKLNATGSGLVYSTFFNSTYYGPTGIAVDTAGNVFITGVASSPYGVAFPTTPNAFSQSCQIAPNSNGTTSAFLSVLNSSGSGLLYSTCFGAVGTAGGPPAITGLVIDSNERAFIVGNTLPPGSVPTTPNAFQSSFPGTGEAAFVTVFDTKVSGASSLVYSTYLGIPATSQSVSASSIAIDSFGKIYVAGSSNPGFPVTPGAYQTDYPPCIRNGVLCPPSEPAFIAKLDPSASGAQSLIYATYLGGLGNTAAFAIAVDSSGAAYITGDTSGSYYQSFPITPGAYLSSVGENAQAGFVTKLNAAGSGLAYSTLLSGNSPSVGNGIVVDALGNAYVAGYFRAGGPANPFFPVTADAFQSSFTKLSGDFSEAFLTKLNPDGSNLVYSSYLGGEGDDVATSVAIDQNADAYVVGHTSSATFPITSGAFQPVRNGTGDAFITKFPLGVISGVSITGIIPGVGGNSGSVTAYITGSGLEANATLELVCSGQSPVLASNVSVSADGRTITGTFDLTGTNPGACTVEVINPDGTNASASQPFTVQAGGAPEMWVDIVGRQSVRGGVPAEYYVVYGNRGNIDAKGIVVSIGTPNLLTWTLLPGQIADAEIQTDGNTLRAFDVPIVPPQSSAVIVISVIGPNVPHGGAAVPFQIRAFVSP